VPFNRLLKLAAAHPANIVLPEGDDPRVIRAARRAVDDHLVQPILLGSPDSIAEVAKQEQINLEKISVIDPENDGALTDLTQQLQVLRAHKGMTLETAAEAIQDRLHYGCMMVKAGLADGCVAGAVYPTATVVRTAMQLVGKHPDFNFVSSFFIMLMQPELHPIQGAMVFADCALMVDPDAQQLADIAIMTGESAASLLGLAPEIAMLSFSTNGSARHSMVTKVIKATELARSRRPKWRIIGDVQLDAAVVPEILAAKAPDLATGKPVNILVFPDLNAGNIGYKLVERFGGADAIGPVLQGLAKPVNDLSRGCSDSDIYNIMAVTAVQAKSI